MIPGVTEWRMAYPFCSLRCLADKCRDAFGIEQATLTSIRSEEYEMHETYVLGQRESTQVKKEIYRNANDPEMEATEDEEWKTFCIFEYRGQPRLCNCVYEKHADHVQESAMRSFQSAADDEQYLSFEYLDAEEQTEIFLQYEEEGPAQTLATEPAAIRFKIDVCSPISIASNPFSSHTL